MSRVSYETRDRAATICQVAASSHLTLYGARSELYGAREQGALALAMDAWRATLVVDHDPVHRVRPYSHAEAECLLRDGWCPGDEVTSV